MSLLSNKYLFTTIFIPIALEKDVRKLSFNIQGNSARI